jgi:mitotic spindle assembly checkpoint protein MAD1
LRNENELLVKELDALDLQVSRLSYAHNNGAYNPLTTKVLELRDNPDRNDHAIRTASLERLKDENAALLDRITTLEKRKTSNLSTSEQSEALVPRESLVSLQKEFAELQAVIEQKEKMNKRMIDVRLPPPSVRRKY